MKALVFNRYGGPDQIAFANIPRPLPKPDEILVQTHAVGLNPLVQAASPLLLLAGQIRGAISPMDVAGVRRYTVDEVRLFLNDLTHQRNAFVGLLLGQDHKSQMIFGLKVAWI